MVDGPICVVDCSSVCNKYGDGKHLETFMIFDIVETSSPVIIFLGLPICNSITIVSVHEGLEMKETERSVFFPISNYTFIVSREIRWHKHGPRR